MSSFVTSVGAVDTSEAEIEYSLMYLDRLPKEDSSDFNALLRAFKLDDLDENRVCIIEHSDGLTDITRC